MEKNDKQYVLVIGGPSGVGESTVTRAILKKYPNFKRLVTATTRSPRLQEKDKIDYYFFSEVEFKEKIKKGDILEHTYNKERDVYYGSYKPDLESKLSDGYSVIVNPDIVGAKYYKENYNAITIFIMPSSFEELKKRQLARNPNIAEKELDKRLSSAKREIEDESSFYDYKVINEQGKLDKAVEEVISIINK
jgi:guanylate kinase